MRSRSRLEQDRPDIAGQRAAWCTAQGGMSPASLTFVDDVGAATDMARGYGRSPQGQRLDGSTPDGPCVDAPLRRKDYLGAGSARDRVPPCVRPLMRHGRIEGDLDEAVRASPTWRAAEEMLASVPGVGKISACTLIAG